eukprot:SAG11_NODE_71_length_18338_cov_14.752974_3_plen_2964_part_00
MPVLALLCAALLGGAAAGEAGRAALDRVPANSRHQSGQPEPGSDTAEADATATARRGGGGESDGCNVVTGSGSGSGSTSCSCLVFASARFSVLTPSVIRMENHAGCNTSHAAGSDVAGPGCFEDAPSTTFTNRAPPAPQRGCTWTVRASALGRVLEINTSALALRYTGGAFTAASLSITDLTAGAGGGGAAVWRPGSADSGNLNGTFTSKDCGGMNPLTAEVCIHKYQSMMQPGLLTRGFGVLIDDTHAFLFDGDRDWPPYGWRKLRRNLPAYTDHTFFGHGRNYRQAMKEFIQLSGAAQLMPHRHYGFVFSDHQSNLFTEDSIKAMIENFTALDLPLNYLVLDENWHYMGSSPSPGQCSVPGAGVPPEYQCGSGFGGFTWDRSQVPDPAAFQQYLHDRNLSLMLNVHDQCGYDHCQRGYAEARAAVPGLQGAPTNATVPCQFENARLQAAFFEHNLESGENAGVDSWWTDLGDMSTHGNYSVNGQYTWPPGTWENWRCLDDSPGTGNGTRDVSTASTLWTAYVKASRQFRRGKRSLSLGVYGGLGHHRLPMVGSGDTVQDWPTIAYEIYMTITSANVAVPWLHDLGGFIPQPALHTPEMFLRWLQWGLFSPAFRTHCAGCELRPWKFENFDQLRPVYQMRNAMSPYLYSASAAAVTTGILPLHPLYVDWPDEESAYDFSFFNMSYSSPHHHNSSNQSSSCLTEPKAGVGADDGQAGNPRSCDPGISWCNGFRTDTASACAAACCAIKSTGASTMICGGYTWDPKQADTSGGTRCPVGGPCCWLKQAPSALGKGPARYFGAVRAPAPAKQLKIQSLEYSWGKDMVVAPIFSPMVSGSVGHSVWIPPGDPGWIRWQTGELYFGPRVTTQEFTQEEILVFVRAGAVIPMKTMEAVHDVAPAVLVLQVPLPGNGTTCAGTTTVYEDDGVSMAYADSSAYRTMEITQTTNSSCTRVQVVPHSGGGGYQGEPRRRWYNIELLCQTPMRLSRVTVNGAVLPALSAADTRAQGWWRAHFGPNQVPTLVVGTGAMDAAQASTIEIVPMAYHKTDDAASVPISHVETDWISQAGTGIFVHYLQGIQNNCTDISRCNSQGKNTSWSQCVDEFDVDIFAKDAAATGAQYVIFTMMQATQFMIAPNAAYDNYTGYAPGQACSKRDLVLHLSAALGKHGLKLLLYWTGDGPRADPQAANGLGWAWPTPDKRPMPEFLARWAAVLREYAVRYGTRVAGWWVDGCHAWRGYNETNLRGYHDAIRAGNPKALIALNNEPQKPINQPQRSWANGGEVTTFEDMAAGESNDFLDVPTSRWVTSAEVPNVVQWHALTFLGQTWGAPGLRVTPKVLRVYTMKVRSVGGVLSVDVQCFRNGSLNADQVSGLAAAWMPSDSSRKGSAIEEGLTGQHGTEDGGHGKAVDTTRLKSDDAATTMVSLFTDLESAHVQRSMTGSAGGILRQLDVVARKSDTGYIGVHTDTAGGGVCISVSNDLQTFRPVGLFEQASASAPNLVAVSGHPQVGNGNSWWMLAFETEKFHERARTAAAPASPACAGILVSSAGTKSVNGCYKRESGQRWTMDSTHSIYPYRPHGATVPLWHIGTEGKTVFYATAKPSAAPPQSGDGGCGLIWTTAIGLSPCPAVHIQHSAPPSPAPRTTAIGFALFISEADLLSGNASRVFVAPNSPLLPAGQRLPVTPPVYSSPTIYSAVHSRRGGQSTVDVVLGLAWHYLNQSHPANALLSGLGPHASSQVTAVDYNTFFSFDGAGYDGSGKKAAGPLHWEINLRAASDGFAYSGSSSAFVPCGPGCGDPRDRAGGNADGMPGTQKLSLVAGSDSELMLWAWDPIVKARWLWPSGFGTAQGGFNKSAVLLHLPGVRLAARSDPKMEVVPCPQDIVGTGFCLWVGLMTASEGQLSFYRKLDAQDGVQQVETFPRRYKTITPPIVQKQQQPALQQPPGTAHGPEVATRNGLTLQNQAFKVVVAADGSSFTLTEIGSSLTRSFHSRFSVVGSDKDPQLSDMRDGGGAHSGSGLYFVADDIPSYWRRNRTLDVTKAGDSTVTTTASSCQPLNGTAITMVFSDGGHFVLQASIALPTGMMLPRLSWSLAAKITGYFTVGFVGAPALATNESVPFAQTGNCFSVERTTRCPLNESIVFPDAGANLPYAMTSDKSQANVALISDPSTFPFQPCLPWPDAGPQFSKTCPTNACAEGSAADACQNRGWASEARSSIGIQRGDQAVPLIFAPVFGGFQSRVSAGHQQNFTLQLLVCEGSPSDAYRRLASEVYGFRDERDNSGPGSLNTAIERMADYLADADGLNLLQWDAVQKYSFYWMDNACAFKPLDFMSGLSIALLTDDLKMYTLFAREMAKFSLSHSDKEKYLWPYESTVGLSNSKDSAGHFGMAQNHGSGFANAAEIMQIYWLTGSRSSALPVLAGLMAFNETLPCPNADSNYDTLLYYQLTTGSSKEHWWSCTLEAASHLMMRDAKTPKDPSEYKCTNTDFFVSLFALTHQTKYKEAALLCEANCEVKYQVFPRATAADGEMITVDAGNRSLSYWWTHGRWGSWGWPLEKQGMWARKQTVPTWRASHNGLVTSGGGGGGGWLGTLSLDSPVRMLRAATLSNDSYARALARASIVGRFGHFPGDFQSKPKHTLLWEAPDLADHILPKETQTTWNTGHFWPVAANVLDFLMTDAADRSNNSILFPSTYINSIPFGRLYSPALGNGSFYDEPSMPWVPAGLFKTVSNAQFNWMAAYSEDAVFIAMISQSFSEESVTCVLNDELIGGLESASISRVWRNNVETAAQKIPLKPSGGSKSFTISGVPGKGMVALKLPGAVAKTRLHRKVLAPGLAPLSSRSRVVGTDGNGAFGIVSGIALRWGRNMTELYAFSQANSTMFRSKITKDDAATSHVVFDRVSFHWRVDNGAEHELTGTMFPFDFSVWLPDDCASAAFRFTGISSTGIELQSRNYSVEVSWPPTLPIKNDDP